MRSKVERWLKIAALFAWPVLVAAGSQFIVQSGNVTGGHAMSWASSGVAQDAGTSATGNISSLGVYGNGGTPFCVNSAQSSTAARVVLCMGTQLNNSAYLSLSSQNGAATVPFDLVINGIVYPFPGTPSTIGTLRQVSSGTTDSATSADGTVAWNSSSALAKTESLYACSSGSRGNLLTVVDEKGTAGTYPITLSPAGGNTINGGSTYIMAFNNQSTTLQCAGSDGNWVVN